MSNPLSRALKSGSGGNDSSDSKDSSKQSVEDIAERVRGGASSKPKGATDTDGDGDPDASVPPDQQSSQFEGATDTDGDGDPDASVPSEESGSGSSSKGSSGSAVSDAVNTVVDRVKNAVSGSDKNDSPNKKEVVTRNVSSEGASDPKTDAELNKEVIQEAFNPDEGRVQEGKQFVKSRGLDDAESVEKAVNRELPFQTERTQNAFEQFSRAVKVEEKVSKQKEAVNERIQQVKSSDSDTFVNTETGEKVSKEKVLKGLRNTRKQLDRVQSGAASAQKDIAFPGEDKVIPLSSLPDDVARELKNQQDSGNQVSNSRNVEYAGYTDIKGVRSQADPLSNPEVLENYKKNLEGAKDVAAVLATPAGVQAAFSVFDPEKTGAGIINRKSEEIGSMGPVESATQLLSSPAGLVLGGAAGKAAAGGLQGVRAGLGSTASSLLSGLEYGAAGAGSLFVGSEIGRGAAQASKGDISKGLARVALTGAEAGAVAKGFASGLRKYSPTVSGSTTVRQTNFLEQVADEDTLRGFGSLEARTPVTRNKLFGGSETDEVVSTAGYSVKATDQGSTASGTLVQEQVSGGTVEKDFESFTNVRGQEVDTVFVDEEGSLQRFDVAGDEAVSSSTVRFKDDSGLFRDYEDFSTISASRKQGEKPVSSIDVYSEQQLDQSDTAVLRGVSDDVAVRVRSDVDARRVRFSSRSVDDEVVTRADNVVFSRNTDEFGGGSSGGAGLKSGRSGGFVSETERQVRAAEALGERSRRMVQRDLGSDSVTFTAAGGGGGAAASGSQASTGQIQSRDTVSSQQQQEVQVSSGYEPVETGEAQRSVSGRASNQVRRDGNVSQGIELNSTASELVREKKNEMVAGRSVQDQKGELVQDQAVEQDQVLQEKQVLDKTQKLNPVKPRSKVRGRGVQALKAAGVPQVSGLRTVQIPQSKQIQKLSVQGVGETLGFTGITVPGTGGPGAGGFLLQSPEATKGSLSDIQRKKTGLKSARYVNPDWFSANAVEQVTDEQAVYDLSKKANNSLFGLKAVQESEGKVSEREIYDAGKKGDLL